MDRWSGDASGRALSTVRLPVRRPAAGRRAKSPSRASSGISWTRVVGALALVAVSGFLYWLTVAEEFAVDPATITIEGARYTDVEEIRARLDMPGAAQPNIFRVATGDIQARIEELPPVLTAQVVATLPDRVGVVIHERAPILTWQVAADSSLVDVEGVLFAGVDPADGEGPSISDQRAADAGMSVGSRLDPDDLEIVRLLGALVPADLDSAARELRVSVDDESGWVVTAPGRWRAVFGFYTPDLRTSELIPEQVQCLRSLLADREDEVGEVVLSVGADRCGTYLPAGPPAASGRPAPSRAP
jgi:POTRA domain, FtsQ-type